MKIKIVPEPGGAVLTVDDDFQFQGDLRLTQTSIGFLEEALAYAKSGKLEPVELTLPEFLDRIPDDNEVEVTEGGWGRLAWLLRSIHPQVSIGVQNRLEQLTDALIARRHAFSLCHDYKCRLIIAEHALRKSAKLKKQKTVQAAMEALSRLAAGDVLGREAVAKGYADLIAAKTLTAAALLWVFELENPRGAECAFDCFSSDKLGHALVDQFAEWASA